MFEESEEREEKEENEGVTDGAAKEEGKEKVECDLLEEVPLKILEVFASGEEEREKGGGT